MAETIDFLQDGICHKKRWVISTLPVGNFPAGTLEPVCRIVEYKKKQNVDVMMR
jgi:hypothetical protein